MATTQKTPPSDKAVDRAEAVIATSPRKAVYEMAYDLAHAALTAAHDPALGLDRSVCLRDVVEALRRPDAAGWGNGADYADFIEREFEAE